MEPREKWTEDAVRAVVVHERVLGLIGVWPLTATDPTSIKRWIISMLIQISTILSLSLEVYRHCLNADDTLDAFLMDLSSVVSIAKLFIVRLNWKYTYLLVNSIVEDWCTVDNPRHRLIMTKYFRKGRMVSLIILYLGYASGASFIIKALPFRDLLPSRVQYLNFNKFALGSFNLTSNSGAIFPKTYFLATYCVFGTLPPFDHSCILGLQVAEIFVNATSHCGNDGFFFSLVMHLCGQFQILRMGLAEIDVENLRCRKQLKLLIRRHCHLARLADSLEQAFNMVILIQLLMSALLLCVEGFQLLVALAGNDNVAVAKHAILLVTILVQLFLYAYAGDALESQTAEIPFAVYESSWYEFRGDIARNLPFVILRGSLPHQVTAGRYMSMNLYTFKEILKASMSYLSVMKAMMEA